jgi:hypothetical protein
MECEDGNPCTDDLCDTIEGCVFVNDDSNLCGDADLCNGEETCQIGVCTGGTPLDCDDGNDCTDDSCDPPVGCVHVGNDSLCDDGDACNGEETCQEGRCSQGTPLVCDDDNACTDDACVSPGGCVFTSNNPGACDDGDACTVDDACLSGACQGVAVDCEKAGDRCHWAQCDPAGPEGNCDVLVPKPNVPGCP